MLYSCKLLRSGILEKCSTKTGIMRGDFPVSNYQLVNIVVLIYLYIGQNRLENLIWGVWLNFNWVSCGAITDPRLTDYDTLLQNVQDLKAGKQVQVPIYDFKSSSRIGYRLVNLFYLRAYLSVLNIG